MGGILTAIIALCKAVPVLERLFLGVASGIKEAKAKARYDEKLDTIDSAVANARATWYGMPDDETERGGTTDESSTVSESSSSSTKLHESSTKKSS
tara:strand:- start:257 stop:544 length:288 start_codon:yes stop_codon:yes gene_type:complete